MATDVKNTTVEAKIINLNVMDIQKMQLQGMFPYKTGQRSIDGKTFHRFSYNGCQFSVPSDEKAEFITLKHEGKLASVQLKELTHAKTVQVVDEKTGEVSDQTIDVKYYELVSYVSKAEHINALQFLALENNFEALKKAPLTQETLTSLMAAL